MNVDKDEHQVVADEKQRLGLLLEVQTLEDGHDLDDFNELEQLEVLQGAVEFLDDWDVRQLEHVLAEFPPVDRGQAVNEEPALQVVNRDALGLPDELSQTVVEVACEEAEDQVTIEYQLGDQSDPLEELPQLLALAQATVLRSHCVDEEELKGNVDSLEHRSCHDAEVEVEQEIVTLLHDVPALSDQV